MTITRIFCGRLMVVKWNVASSHSYVKQYVAYSLIRTLCSHGNTSHEVLEVPENFNFARDVIDKWAGRRKSSHDIALWTVDSAGNSAKLSYADFSQQSKQVAAAFSTLGSLQRAMLILPKVSEWHVINIAALRMGMVLFPGTTQLQPQDIDYRLTACKADCIIADPLTAEKVDKVVDRFPSVKAKILVGQRAMTREGWLNYHSMLEKAPQDFTTADTKSDGTAMVYFTSGTTGSPKMVVHTHASYPLGLRAVAEYWYDLAPEDILWAITDTGWAKAAFQIFGAWNIGSTVFMQGMERFEPEAVLEVLCQYPVTVFCAPPTLYRALVQCELSKYKFMKLRRCLSAGEPLNAEVIDMWEKATGFTIYEGYGQTEIGLQACVKKGDKVQPGSMGKPIPGHDLRIVNNLGEEMPRGEEGIIGVRVKPKPPLVFFAGYLDEPERTRKCFVGDFYLTGDRAYMDEDDCIWFVSRDDDIIISSGYRIGPFDVESALIGHPAVAESAVVSSPDPDRGEVVKAFIILTEKYKNKDPEVLKTEIQKYCQEVTAPYKYPRKIEFVSSLPKTISGKTRRHELRSKEWKKKINGK